MAGGPYSIIRSYCSGWLVYSNSHRVWYEDLSWPLPTLRRIIIHLCGEGTHKVDCITRDRVIMKKIADKRDL